jgi:A/G-specific adenine glycosylase
VGAERSQALLAWYRDNGRDLPWRTTTDPWAILVSEVMSQQTQIARVVPAWTAFMARYPTPGNLADSDRAELIRLWAGLGYQRRAINLQRAAVVVDDRGWPTSVGGLMELPGVGAYTAAAVACFAFGAPVPAIDTNLKRILSRWLGTPLDPAALTAAAASELPDDEAAAWNQALMDLGSELCRPREPRCDACPVAEWCLDPTVYEPPPRQSRYEGSVRQARAAILRMVAASGPTSEATIASSSGLAASTVSAAAAALEKESLLERDGDLLALVSS